MPLYTGGETELTVIFDRRQPEEAEALDYFRAAFAETAEIEAVSEHIYALHIKPGLVRQRKDTA